VLEHPRLGLLVTHSRDDQENALLLLLLLL
jgi:hypothetical protein